MNKFSVVMSVYHGDTAPFFREAIHSLLNQTQPAKEILIVVDGPINQRLTGVLNEVKHKESINIIKLKKNYGHGLARAKGIEQAKYDVIALMDADDISVPSRFEKQLPLIINGKADVVGAFAEEFENIPHDLSIIRKPPVNHKDIYRYGKWRLPINHVTIMFTRQAYNRAGGYGSRRTFEDGELVVRMLVNGVIFHNIPEVLVHFRGGEDMIIRRKRVPFKHALSLLTLQYRLGYTSVFHVCLLSLIRLIVHISPRKVTWLIYRFALRKKIDNHSQRVN